MLICLKIIFALILFFPTLSWATVWYVRDGGGSVRGTTAGTNICSGLVNAVYSIGVSPNCAVSNPMLINGAGCGNYGGSTCTVAQIIQGNDTVNILGDSDITPGAQAQYPIGAGVTTSSGNCSTGINCTMANIPAGSNATSLTTFQGTGTHRPQLYGVRGVNQVVLAANNFVKVSNLEITDHSSCIKNFPVSGTVDGFPLQCATDSGNWGQIGLYYGGNGGIQQNLYIHGLAVWGTDGGDLSNNLATNNIISGNAFGGDGIGNIVGNAGTVNLNNNIWQNGAIVYNGCGEHYNPAAGLPTSDPYNTANYHNCWDDTAGVNGLGDGAGSQAGTAIITGYMKWINMDVSFNTQDCLDYLHSTGGGSVYLIRSRFEGCEGQQIKINNQNLYVENSLIIGDCYYFHGQSFMYAGATDFCRAAGNTIRLVPSSGGSYNFSNSTILGTGPGIIEWESSGTCGGTITIKNNNIIGGYNTPVYGNNTKAVFYDPECSSGSPAVVEDYNHVWNTNDPAHCAGAHDKCNDTTAAVKTTFTTSMIGPVAYYSGNDLGHLLYAASAGQLAANANNALTLQGTSNDFNNFSRGTSWDIGGYQNNSCVASGGTCFASSECCSGASCTNHVCGTAACSANSVACSSPSTCCSLLCSVGACVSCVASGNACSTNSDCCSNICTGSVCIASGGGGATVAATGVNLFNITCTGSMTFK